jgi:5-methyltetrahydropteroyltriglutamate--homocysteine methyltransferase
MIPTGPIGSIPRPAKFIEAVNALGDGIGASLDLLYDEAIRETIEQFKSTGTPVITDGEQRNHLLSV